MTGEQPPTEREIFKRAVQMPAEERAGYLDEACGHNIELRAEVESLLQAHDTSNSFMDRPAIELPADGCEGTANYQPLAEGTGTIIGPYKLLQQIGEGGMGVVFLAQQERPVKRQVALKVIKPGMDTRQVVARFEAERQTLAMMDHPNIAKVHDAGATENGRPYFVMELVQGVLITEYCDQCNLTTRERLELFITVCQAVQHAHQKGIIHRDIKPTNVLVAIQDGRPAPKIIDFGVAKAIEQRLTEHTLTIAFAQMIGSPLYMSPEQAELSPLGIDTRSDIYSLGVLLYELLTGTTPFDKDRLHTASYDELRRIIREEEPPRPSAHISTLAADLATTVAEHRRTDARRLRQTVRGELDWIVMKCLEKDRNRRYETPNSLARDIERYLNDEPVQACPPTVSYRLRKFLRRNKTAAAFICLLVVGIAALTVSNIQTRRNEQRAIAESARAQAVSDFLQEMLASSNPDQVKGANYTMRQWLDDVSARLNIQLAGQPEVEAAIRSIIGKSYWRLGVPDRAELHLKKALDLQRSEFGADNERVGDTLVDYAWSLAEQKRYPEAQSCIHDALLIFRQGNADPRATMRALWCSQEILHRQRRFADAEEVANEALTLAGAQTETDYPELPNILHTLSDSKTLEGKYAEAESLARRAVEMHRRLHGNHHPETAHGLWILGGALKGQQKFAEAEAPLREALAIFREYYTPEHRNVLGVTQELAAVLEARGDRLGAETLVRDEAEQTTGSDSPEYHAYLAELLLTNKSQGKSDEAHRLIRRAIEGHGQVAVHHSDDIDRRLKAAIGLAELNKVCAAAPGFDNEIDEVNRRISAELPQIAHIAKRLADPAAAANALWCLALIQLRMGDESGYRATCKTLIDLPDYEANDVVKARPIWTSCIAPNSLDGLNVLVARATSLVANSTPSQRHFSLYMLGAAHYRSGQYELAVQRLNESVAVYPSAPLNGFDTINYQRLLLAMAKWQLGHRDEARRLFAEARSEVNKELQFPSTLWPRRTTLELLLAETESLIEKDRANRTNDIDRSTSKSQSTTEATTDN